MNLPTVKILSIAGLIIALVVIACILPSHSQAQGMTPEAREESQVLEEQVSPPGNATATITITMTGVADDAM
jgi:hypothetical protein